MARDEHSGSWQGTPKQALRRASELLLHLNLRLDLPLERTIRDWRAEEVISNSGRKFTERNVLELLRAKQLRDQGLPVQLIREHLEGQTDQGLLQALTPERAGEQPSILIDLKEENQTEAEISSTVLLLASAVLKQFRLTEAGAIVGMYRDIPLELRQAQAHLSRLAILGGEDDHFASVHDLLKDCTRPMKDWAPKPIAQHPDYANKVLIDSETGVMVPSEDCAELASKAGHLEDLVEVRLHRQLMDALEPLDEGRRDAAYTLIRRFIGEHPLATLQELHDLKRRPQVQADPALGQFLDHIYLPAHAHDAVNKWVSRCGHCQGPMHGGRCRLPSCRAVHPEALAGDPVPLADAYIVRPALLRYWCDPAQEELRVFRELGAVHPQATTLYPQTDACDVGLGSDIGIDVKDHRDPVRLARRLNDGIGRLTLYRRKILAIATRRVRDESYITRLNEQLSPRLRRQLEVLSVDDTIRLLKALELPHD